LVIEAPEFPIKSIQAEGKKEVYSTENMLAAAGVGFGTAI
jgi:hypothetical protein